MSNTTSTVHHEYVTGNGDIHPAVTTGNVTTLLFAGATSARIGDRYLSSTESGCVIDFTLGSGRPPLVTAVFGCGALAAGVNFA